MRQRAHARRPGFAPLAPVFVRAALGRLSYAASTWMAASGHGLVLVMDDDDMVRRVAGSMLSRLGYEPVLASEGAEALQTARQLMQDGKSFVAALLDLTVRSGQGGREIVGQLRELAPRLPIIASSGYTDDPVMARPTQFGFSASLRKPFMFNELSTMLAELSATVG